MNEEALAEQNNGYFNTRQKKCKFGSKCYNTTHKHPKEFHHDVKTSYLDEFCDLDFVFHKDRADTGASPGKTLG